MRPNHRNAEIRLCVVDPCKDRLRNRRRLSVGCFLLDPLWSYFRIAQIVNHIDRRTEYTRKHRAWLARSSKCVGRSVRQVIVWDLRVAVMCAMVVDVQHGSGYYFAEPM